MENEIKELETIIFKLVRNKFLEEKEKEIIERIVEKEIVVSAIKFLSMF